MTPRKVAIVGGGPSGLFSAFLLQMKSAQPLDITLYERGTRLGGKLLTHAFQSAPILYEAGAAELYQYKRDPLRVLITKVLGLPTSRMQGQGVYVQGRFIERFADIRAHLGPRASRQLKRIKQLAFRERPFRRFYSSGWPRDNTHPFMELPFADLIDRLTSAQSHHYFTTLLHSDLATEPEHTNALYGIENYLINFKRYCKLYSIDGGMSRLIDALVERIRAHVVFSARVDAIGPAPEHKYRLSVNINGDVVREDYDAVVAALPIAWLRGVEWQDVELRSAFDAHCARYDTPAHYLRISILFERPFWRPRFKDTFFQSDAFGGCCIYDEGRRHHAGSYGVLSWLLAGNAAVARGNSPDACLVDEVLHSLPSEFGPRAPVLESQVHRWIGAVSAQPGGVPLRGVRQRHRVHPRHPRIMLVGDYLFDATINGAFDSADIATGMLLRGLKIGAQAVSCDYFDYYDGERRYADVFAEYFDANYLLKQIKIAFALRPPFSLLDAGSADGSAIRQLLKKGVDAHGVEKHWYIHGQTRRKLLDRNKCCDIRELPHADNSFDIVYDTCLCYVPREQLPAALREMHRVARRGVVLGSLVKDMRRSAQGDGNGLFADTQSVLSLKRWSKLFQQAGFRRCELTTRQVRQLWRLERKASDGKPWYPAAESLRYVFYDCQKSLGPPAVDCADGLSPLTNRAIVASASELTAAEQA